MGRHKIIFGAAGDHSIPCRRHGEALTVSASKITGAEIMAVKILADVPTSELQMGDVVVHGDGYAYVLQDTEPDPGGGYGALYWSEQLSSGARFTTTARPGDAWTVVVRDER
jgi:hypothetical protein